MAGGMQAHAGIQQAQFLGGTAGTLMHIGPDCRTNAIQFGKQLFVP